MKKIKLLTLLVYVSLLVSCSKDDAVPAVPAANYAPFGYFFGTIEFAPYTADDRFPSIVLLENDNKLALAFNALTVNQSANTLKGTYTVTSNQIFGSYSNPNIIPPTSYSFSATFDATTAKFSGTLGVSPSTTGTGKITFERKN
jgi:hypothetical protein